MEKSARIYSVPVLRKGKKIISVPKGSTKAKEEAKNKWYVEFFYTNPATLKKERFRYTGDLNRISDPAKKLKHFNLLLNEYTDLLDKGWNPFDDNNDLRLALVSLTLLEAQNAFIDYHKNKSSRPSTVVSFRSKTNLLLKYFGADKKISEITTVDMTNFMFHMEVKRSWVAKTFVNSKAAYVNFFNFLKKTGRLTGSPMDKFDETRKVEKSESHQLFSKEHFEKIIKWLTNNDKYALFCAKFLYYTCVRPSELRLLKLKHIDVENQKITIPASISKNRTTQTIHMDEELKLMLLELDVNSFPSSHFLTGSTKNIIGDTAQPEKTLYNRMINCYEKLELDKEGYTLYSIKHYTNVERYRNGWTIAEIKEANRHASLVQTETYLRDLMKNIRTVKSVPAI